jgi:hypothetical protein
VNALIHYTEDVEHFVATSPYIRLMKPRSAVGFLTQMVACGEEGEAVLRDYPQVQVEPLAFFYTCLRSLGALDRPFFEMLVGQFAWRGAVWGAWLAILKPNPAFAPILRGVLPLHPHNAWIVACAIAAIEQRPFPPEYEEFGRLAARCRALLFDVPRPDTPLRAAPTDVEQAQMLVEKRRISDAYKAGGADAARAMLSGTLVAFYRQDYVTWRQSLS